MRISDWSSDVCSSDLPTDADGLAPPPDGGAPRRIGGVARARCQRRLALGNRRRVAADRAVTRGGAARRFPSRRRARPAAHQPVRPCRGRSEEHTSELQSLMRISYAVFCLNKKTTNNEQQTTER